MDLHADDYSGTCLSTWWWDDDDLVKFVVSVETPSGIPRFDEVELSVESGETRMRVWDDESPPNLLVPNVNDDTPYSEQWPAGTWSKNVYVEGLIGSDGDESTDPNLLWRYFGLGHDNLHGWNAEGDDEQWITTLHVDMDMAGVKDENYSPEPGVTEETIPGGFVPVGGFVELTVHKVKGTLHDPDIHLAGSGATSKIEVWTATQGLSLIHI